MENFTKIDSNTLEQTVPEQKITISREQLEGELASIEDEILKIKERALEPFQSQLNGIEDYKKIVLEKLNLLK